MLKKLAFISLCLAILSSEAQVTTATINGTVVDDAGEGLPGARSWQFTLLPVHNMALSLSGVDDMFFPTFV